MIYKRQRIPVFFILFLILCLSNIAYGNEALPKKIAEGLGVSADIGERFETLYEYEPTIADRERPDEEYDRLIVKASYTHGGGDVHIWKIEFTEGYSVSEHIINIYLDSDNDVATGRKRGSPLWDGIDELWTLNNGDDTWRQIGYHWDASGMESRIDNKPRFIPDGNVIYCRYDLSKNRQGSQFVFRARLTSEIPGKTVDRTPWFHINDKAHNTTKSVIEPSTVQANTKGEESSKDAGRAVEYMNSVVFGGGLMSWQEPGITPEEASFRAAIEARKERMLNERIDTLHPIMITEEELQQAKENIRTTPWAKEWFQNKKKIADHIVSQPEGYIEHMIPTLTPGHGYGFTCPNCVGEKSQEGSGESLISWSYTEPDIIRCKSCGQIYPDEKYPESATLQAPRSGQAFTYYLNEAEQKNPNDRSGKYAWRWVGMPVNVSFTGIVRQQKTEFMVKSLKDLSLVYRLTDDPRYAQAAVEILVRLAHAYRNWLYHDYWGTIADCDPMYAAWHHNTLRLEWKRHLCLEAFAKDTPTRASMLRDYWGSGRIYPSTDNIGLLENICMAYDLLYDAVGTDGEPLWTSELREKVEKDLILEYVIGAEPYVGGEGKAKNANNKTPRIYLAQAAVSRVLGLPELADTALRGYELIRDTSFVYDGASRETPAYTNMYLETLVYVPEMLHGFHWPEGMPGREGVLDIYENDKRLKLMYQVVMDQLRPDGYHLPLGDTQVDSVTSNQILEIGAKRYPEIFLNRLATMASYGCYKPTEYAILRLDLSDVDPNKVKSGKGLEQEEVFFPGWKVAILRHGVHMKEATTLTLSLSPPGPHRHNDPLGLYYFDSGQEILGDLGYVRDMPVNQWVSSGLSHNLVLIDGKVPGYSGRLGLNMMVTSPNVSIVEGGYDEEDRRYRRLIALIKGPDAQTFAVDIFRVKGGEKHTYRLYSDLAASDSFRSSLQFKGINMPKEPPLPNVAGSVKKEDIFGLRDIRTAENPPTSWQATWQERGRSYRLWMLSQANSVEASNGPGQRTGTSDQGRRIRYIDVIREGTDLESTFVAIHEPSTPNGAMFVTKATRLDVPESAGPDAVALLIDSKWGTYFIFSEFENEAEVEGIRFKGTFGVLYRPPVGIFAVFSKSAKNKPWLLSCGASTFKDNDIGFEDAPEAWSDEILNYTEETITAASPLPSGLFKISSDVTPYVIVNYGFQSTGFPVDSIEEDKIRVKRFPVQSGTEFYILGVQYIIEE